MSPKYGWSGTQMRISISSVVGLASSTLNHGGDDLVVQQVPSLSNQVHFSEVSMIVHKYLETLVPHRLLETGNLF